MSGTLRLRVERGVAELRLGRGHGNAINPRMVEDLLEACRALEADDGIRGVLLAADGKLFCPGLDLLELCELDRPALGRFLRRFNEMVLRLYALRPPVVAALHGHAVAGGCVLALTADWRVLQSGAQIGLSEVRVGVPFPYGVALILRESVPRERLEEVALLGRNYRDRDAVEAGLVHELRPAEGFEPHCRERLEELLERDPNALAVTKRYLRAATVERIRAAGSTHDAEFLDGWFRPETQERIARLVAGLRERER